MDFHAENPAPRLEAVFEHIRVERMADMPMLNPALAVAAVGFERRADHLDEWRGVLVTPWGINLLLLPAAEIWRAPQPHERVFRKYAAGTFAFLGNREDGVGDYLACPLIHDMQQFANQETAVHTGRACLIALDLPPATAAADPGQPARPDRRRFMLRPTS